MVTFDGKTGQVVFAYQPSSKARKVSLVGEFNSWDPEARRMVKHPRSGTFRARLDLAPGRYEYKMVVDGEWVVDADNPEQASNPYGTHNSVVVVPACCCSCDCE